MYDSMRGGGIDPLRSFHCVLIDIVLQMKRTVLAFQIAFDIIIIKI